MLDAQAGLQDARFMRWALDLARTGEKSSGAGPIGCVIVKGGEIICEGHNEMALKVRPKRRLRNLRL